MENNKQPKRDGDDEHMKKEMHRKKIIIPLAVVAGILAAVAGIAYAGTQQQQQAVGQNLSLGEFANSLKPINPQAIVVLGKLDNVNGVALTETSTNTISQSIVREDGVSRGIEKQGQAEMTLYQTVSPDGDAIIAVTLTNIGTNKFYLKELAIGGETTSGVATLSSTALDADYSQEVYGTIPKPTMTELVTLNPGDSITAYIKGKFIEQTTDQPITKSGGAALYYYDESAPDYNNGFNWNIAATN